MSNIFNVLEFPHFMDNKNIRRDALDRAGQIIVKAGTRLLISKESIAELVSGIALLRQKGYRVLLVTSGAVGRGMEALGIKKRPRKLAGVQALAAIGQSELMSIYSAECRKHGFIAAQLLLTAADLRNRERYLNVMNCINALWDDGVLPIVNENDSVSVAEIKFGDNDTLAGMLTSLTDSGLAIILTTEDGLRNRNADGSLSERISTVSKLTESIKALAGGTDNSEFSVGGMASKLRAADIVTSAGAYLWIADGRKKNIISDIIDGKDVGTVFAPAPNRMQGRKRWLTFFSRTSGTVTVDAGAEKAVTGAGKSLLPSGVVGFTGDFKRGDALEIVSLSGKIIARGLSNFSSGDFARIIGKKSSEIHKILGEDADEEIIHRDNMTLLQ